MDKIRPWTGNDRYIITRQGYIFDCKTGRPKSFYLRNGYKTVVLNLDGKNRAYYLHRLLAEAFIPKEHGKRYVNHIDGDRLNDDLHNLEWCTAQENIDHGYRIRGGSRSSAIAIRCLETNEEYMSVREWSKVYNMCPASMYAHLSGENQTCAGKHWIKN